MDKLNKDDFVFTFESQGTTFIFEDFVVKYYLRALDGEYLKIYRDGKIRVFITRAFKEQLHETGVHRTTEDTQKVAETIRTVSAEVSEKLKEYRGKDTLSLDEVTRFFELIGTVASEYGYFDMNYWDGAYEKSLTDKNMAENIKLVESLKNTIREELNLVFFPPHGGLPVIIEKLSKQFSLPRTELEWYSTQEVFALFAGKKVTPEQLVTRQALFVVYQKPPAEPVFLTGREAEAVANLFRESAVETKVVKGKVANGKGKVRGRVSIIRRDYSNDDATQAMMRDMPQGNILVSETTDPDLMEALRKAGAIITDIGGMLSHAAISARELNIPCIVDTGNVTRVLHNNDLVEVDVGTGIITILEKATEK